MSYAPPLVRGTTQFDYVEHKFYCICDSLSFVNKIIKLPLLIRSAVLQGEMASAVTRVIHRCEAAAENESLDLSDCQLMQVPDAVYHLMRHTELKTCDLSDNVITKIPPKFATKFNHITDLNLSHNQVSKLPDECVGLGELERIDISHNTFIELPTCIFKIPKLRHINASNNSIVDLDVDCLREAPSLESIDLTNNPLAPRIYDQLSRIPHLQIALSPREKEDWEDLTI